MFAASSVGLLAVPNPTAVPWPEACSASTGRTSLVREALLSVGARAAEAWHCCDPFSGATAGAELSERAPWI